jgi:hypothetical protein
VWTEQILVIGKKDYSKRGYYENFKENLEYYGSYG